ncbi:MAG: hypothetical protein IT454_05850 [Planctomycetes bacterium]|nr:hypothetical protein [Planctomycetota bacterium]
MPQPSIVANYVVDGLPVDLVISPDESTALLRTASRDGSVGRTYMLDLSVPGTPPLTLLHSHPTNIFQVADFVDALDSSAIATSWGASTPPPGSMPIPSQLAIFDLLLASVLNTSAVFDSATDIAVGHAPVSMLPLAAVIHDSQPVSFWDLSTGLPWGVLSSLPFPSICPPSNGSTQGMADSIAMTASRVIALRNAGYPQGPPGAPASERGFIGIAQLSVPSPGWPKSHGFTACPPQPMPAIPYELVHDLAVTSDGLKTVVSGTRVIAVVENRSGTLLDVRQGSTLPTPAFHVYPTSWITADSVEVTNTRAVVIGNATAHSGVAPINVPPPANDPETFRVAVVDIQKPTGPYSTAVISATGMVPPVAAPARASDLAISPDGTKAIVSTRAGALVLDLTVAVTQTPLSPAPQWFPGAPDPLSYTPTSFYPILISDSAACSDSAAIVIGRSRASTSSGQIWVLDWSTAGPPTATTIDLGAAFLPTDVALTPDRKRAVVRSIDLQGTRDGRITLVELPSGAVAYDATSSPVGPAELGRNLGRDHVECSAHFAISAGQDGAGTIPPIVGWVQIVRF